MRTVCRGMFSSCSLVCARATRAAGTQDIIRVLYRSRRRQQQRGCASVACRRHWLPVNRRSRARATVQEERGDDRVPCARTPSLCHSRSFSIFAPHAHTRAGVLLMPSVRTYTRQLTLDAFDGNAHTRLPFDTHKRLFASLHQSWTQTHLQLHSFHPLQRFNVSPIAIRIS